MSARAVEGAAGLYALAAAAERELTEGILPYWLARAVDARHGGFVGLIDADDVAHPDAPKGAILNARILWTFSAASRVLDAAAGGGRHRAAYRAAAARALRFVRERLLDPVHGGVYWMVNADGSPRDARKHVYAQAFAIYALSEHARAAGDDASLRDAVGLFRLVERHARDAEFGGYAEAFTREWAPLGDARLGDGDADEAKSANTHLHVLEAYAGLYRAWPDPLLRERLTAVVELFLAHVVDARSGRLRLFFDRDWTCKSDAVSYGHDVEASWLLLDAADALSDPALRARVRPAALALAAAVCDGALDAESGGIYYEARPGAPGGPAVVDTDKEWWPQAEAVVGFVNAWQEGAGERFLRAARETWAVTDRHIVDHARGEWLRRVTREGVPRPGYEKVGPWKCPYHNGRACLELIARAADVAARGAVAPREVAA